MNTLFVDPKLTVEQFKRRYNTSISIESVGCADAQLTNYFELRTGLKSSKNVSISWATEDAFHYTVAEISRLTFDLYINHNWNPITVL